MSIVFTDPLGRRFVFTRQQPATQSTPPPVLRDQAQSTLAGLRSTTPQPWQTLWRQWYPSTFSARDDDIRERLAQDLVAKKVWLVPEAVPANAPPANTARSSAKKSPPPEELVPVRYPSAPPPPSTEPNDRAATRAATPSKASPDATTGATPFAQTETKGCPISMVSGEEVLPLVDATLPGPVPFVFQRFYRSGHRRDTGLGMGWTHSGGDVLRLESQTALLSDNEGRLLRFALPALYQRSKLLNEGLDLDYVSADCFILKQVGQNDKVFTRTGASNLFTLTQIRHPAYRPARTLGGIAEPARGFCLNFQHDAFGRLLRVEGNWGKALRLARNDSGHIVSLTLENTRTGQAQTVAEYDYDSDGHLIAQSNAQGAGERYTYAHDLLTQRQLASGFNYYYEWDRADTSARCVHTWGDNNTYDYRFKWDPDNNASCATDSRGHTTTYVYDDFGHIVHKIDPERGVHRYQYTDGQLTGYIDPTGATTHYLYDEANRPAGSRDALGHYRTVYYFQGRPTEVTDPGGARWKRSYNALGQVESVTDPAGAVTRFTYTPEGLISTVTDPAGRSTRYSWNDRAELIRETGPLGHALHYLHDDFGRVVQRYGQMAGQSLDEALASATRYEYTVTGRIAAVIDANGNTARFTYNDADQLTDYTDPHGRTTHYHYDDKLTQPTARIDPAGQMVRYEYDPERNLIALINENGDHYRFVYDANERLIKETGFDGRTQHYQYNAAGHLIKHLDSGEVQTEFERDALGRLQTKQSRLIGDAPGTHRERTRYRHDGAGRLLETYNEHQYLSFEYDPLGNVLTETHNDLNEQRERIREQRIQHRYNTLGQRVHTTLPDENSIDYTFDANLAFSAAAFNGQVLTAIERDPLGRERARHHGPLTTHTEYDPQGRLHKQYVSNQQNSQSPIQREYGYDPIGNLSFFKDGNDETQFHYDALNRLTQAIQAKATPEFFAFDPAGNLLAMSDNAPTAPGLVKGNRLLIQGDKKFTYDARGNLVQETRGQDGKQIKRFTYNLNNQLIEVKSNHRDQNVSFKYDPLGRRIEKQDAFGATRYLWTDNLLAQEQRNDSKKTYVYEPQTFKPIAQIHNGKIYHYHVDHLGTPRELTDPEGKIVWKAKYKTYGNLALKEVEEVENNLRFQGQYFDEETGLHYNRFRYYHPGTGQFINQDPIGLLGGLNNYQYAPNPVQWIDPLGLCKDKKTADQREVHPISKDDIKFHKRYGGEEYEFYVDGPNGPLELAYTTVKPDEKSLEFYINNTFNKGIIIKGTGFGLTNEILKRSIDIYAAEHGAPPEYLNGTIIKKNLSNFQVEYDKARNTLPLNTPKNKVSEEAIKNISFGKERVNLGYDQISVDAGGMSDVEVDGKKLTDVPTKVKITAGRKPDGKPV